MIMVTGGAHQGKGAYAAERLGVRSPASGATCSFEEALAANAIADYHLLIRRLLEEGADPIAFTQRLCEENKGCIIIIDEVGSGIVPIEKSERTWREQVGRCGCMIAKNSAVVIRLCCGIPTAIKGELL